MTLATTAGVIETLKLHVYQYTDPTSVKFTVQWIAVDGSNNYRTRTLTVEQLAGLSSAKHHTMWVEPICEGALETGECEGCNCTKGAHVTKLWVYQRWDGWHDKKGHLLLTEQRGHLGPLQDKTVEDWHNEYFTNEGPGIYPMPMHRHEGPFSHLTDPLREREGSHHLRLRRSIETEPPPDLVLGEQSSPAQLRHLR